MTAAEARDLARYSPSLARTLEGLDKRDRDAVRSLLQEQKGLESDYRLLDEQNAEMTEQLEEAGIDPEPSVESLAEEGEVRFKVHDVAVRDQPLSPVAVEELGLDATQAAGVEEILRGTADGLGGELRDILADMTGDPSLGADYSVNALIGAIRDASGPDAFDAAVRLVAREIAGGAAPPADPHSGTAAEQMLRAIFAAQEDQRRALEELLGPELAASLLDHPELKGTDHSYQGDGGGAQGEGEGGGEGEGEGEGQP